MSNVISSPESADGVSLSNWPDGQLIKKSGQGRAHVSPTRSGALRMAERRATAIAAISGRNSLASSKTVSLQLSLESRLQARYRGDGGTGQQVTLKPVATPLGRQFCALIHSGQDTNGKDSTGWPTPAARDGKDISRSNAFLSQRQRHSPSMATRLLERGAPWTVISTVYCIAMGFPSSWNEVRLKAMAMQSCRKLRPNLSARG